MNIKKVVELLKPDIDFEVKLTGIGLFFGRWMESLNRRVVDLESRQLQKGDKGDKGEQGIQGKAGLNGKDGKDGLNGKDGKDGKNGIDGINGKDGISVVSAEIAADGHFVFEMSDGRIIDAGEPISIDEKKPHYVAAVGGHQIYVSTTAPTNPSPNDLWLDIN